MPTAGYSVIALTSMLRRACVVRHAQRAIDPVNHSADDSAVRGDGDNDVALARRFRIRRGERLARTEAEGDQPPFARLHARALRTEPAQGEPPAAFGEERRQDHRGGNPGGAAAGVSD